MKHHDLVYNLVYIIALFMTLLVILFMTLLITLTITLLMTLFMTLTITLFMTSFHDLDVVVFAVICSDSVILQSCTCTDYLFCDLMCVCWRSPFTFILSDCRM